MLTVEARKEQIEKIYTKHLIPDVENLSYSEDGTNELGLVYCRSKHNRFMGWQMNGTKPTCFWLIVDRELIIADDITYEIEYPEGKLKERLQKLGELAKTNFWKGEQI